MRFLGSAVRVVLLIALAPFALFGGLLVLLYCWIAWPIYRRWRQKPFDPVVWKEAPPAKGHDARLWMVDDVVQRIRGKSREEVLTLLGEPELHYGHMAYGLAPVGLFGKWKLLVFLDEQERVKEARVIRAAK